MQKSLYCKLLLMPLVLFFACNKSEKVNSNAGYVIPKYKAVGKVIPADSILPPSISDAPVPKVAKASKPVSVPVNKNDEQIDLNFSLAHISEVHPKVCTPGKDTIALPLVYSAEGRTLMCGLPDVTIAKEANSKDKNAYSFSSYKILQGLKNHNIRCVLQDRKGNLWLGTRGNGVIRFDGKNFSHFDEKQGLCNNFVWSLLEDKQGNIWIGTQFGGVDKYDGKTFTNYSSENGLKSNVVYSIVEDKNGSLWFGTESGTVVYDGKVFKNYSVKQGFQSNVIWAEFIDSKGQIWFGTNLGGVTKFDGEKFTTYSEKDGLTGSTVYSINEDANGHMFFGTAYGVKVFDGKKIIPLVPSEEKKENQIYSILIDSRSNKWFTSLGEGIYRLKNKLLTHLTAADGIASDFVWNSIEDKSGHLWFATATGLSKYSGELFNHYTTAEGLNNNFVQGIMQDEKGQMFFATYGGGLSVFDGKKFDNYTTRQGLGNDQLKNAVRDRKGNIWMGCGGDGVFKFDGTNFENYFKDNGFGNSIITAMMVDNADNLWVAAEGAVVKKEGDKFIAYGDKNGINGGIVYCMLQDVKGNYWFGTPNYLLKFDGNKFTRYTVKDGLPDKSVQALLEDSKGNIWICTKGGIAKYDGDYFSVLTEKEGLSNNIVLSAIEDREGDLWFGTQNGLSKLLVKNIALKSNMPELPLFKNYNYDDGFLGTNCRHQALFQDKNGDIWIGAGDRLTKYHPKGDYQDTIAPNIQLINVDLFNESVDWTRLMHKRDTSFELGNGILVHDFNFTNTSEWYNIPQNLNLAYNNNNVSFKYIGISLIQSSKVKYKFKLEPLESNWSALTSKTEANYANLSHGVYTFKVKAMSSEGYWSNEFEYTFTIHPPWWKTWWFYTISTILALSALVIFFQYRTASLRRRQRELQETVRERTKEVTLQKQEIEENRKEILDSINYAKRIQYALLASDNLLASNLPEYFVFFKPKDIVSGDFYWAAPTADGFVLIVADCTGHGVPGAFMSLLNISKLSQAINENKITRPDLVLNNVRSEIIKALNPEGSIEESKDGMDAVLCKLNLKEKKLEYAAANNSFYIIRNTKESSELLVCKPDKMPVGAGHTTGDAFTYNEVHLQKGDMIYLLTDGYADQFGGEKGKKFKYKQLEDLLLSISAQGMQHQKEHIENAFSDWKRNLEQVDDICIIGIRV